MKVIAVIQARTGSTRLPSKVLMDIEGETMLERVYKRVRQAEILDDVVIATSIVGRDRQIAVMARDYNWPCYRGSDLDVLDRIYYVGVIYRADAVVRINADCPLIDAGVITKAVEKFKSMYPDVDYVSNVLPRTYPRGLDTEVIKVSTLHKEWRECKRLREHVTMRIRENVANYKIGNVANDDDYSFMRWTVDTMEDMEFIRKIYRQFRTDYFGWGGVLLVLKEHPDWVIIDNQVDPK